MKRESVSRVPHAWHGLVRVIQVLMALHRIGIKAQADRFRLRNCPPGVFAYYRQVNNTVIILHNNKENIVLKNHITTNNKEDVNIA